MVSALTSSITKEMEQVVSHKMKRILPRMLSRGTEGVERYMVIKLGGLENRLAKEGGIWSSGYGVHVSAGQQAFHGRGAGSMILLWGGGCMWRMWG